MPTARQAAPQAAPRTAPQAAPRTAPPAWLREPAGYNAESAGLARALGRVLLTPPPAGGLPAGECDRLLADRRDVLISLAGLHRALAPDAPGHPGTTGVAELERDPVGTLGVLLRSHPRGPAARQSPADRALEAPATPAGLAWRDAATRALTAAAERLDPRWIREPTAAWAAVADLAAVSEAFAVADADLAAGTPEHPAGSESTGLRTAAVYCARLAGSGPLAGIPEDLTTPALRYPTPVAEPAQLAGAQRRVTAMLDGTRAAPAPTLLAQLAIGQARAHLAAAGVLRTAAAVDIDPSNAGHRNPELAGRLGAAADALDTRAAGYTEIAEACGPVRGMPPGSGLRAVQQTGEILRHLTRLQETLTPERAAAAAPHLLGFAGQGLELAAALDRAVRRGVAAGDYLVPNPRNARTAPGWVAARLDDPPRLPQATSPAAAAEPRTAAALADAARALGGTPEAARVGAASAAAELQHALNLRAAGRPARPGPHRRPSGSRPEPPPTHRPPQSAVKPRSK